MNDIYTRLAVNKLIIQYVHYNYRTSGYGSELTQRNSLPDIPLTPRERQILEQTAASSSLVRSSHSSESILRDSSPPPKPPLPDR